eukprot:s3201_g12.t1
MLFLMLGRGEGAEARSRVAQAVLLKTRENGSPLPRGAAGRDLEISAFTSGGVNARGPVVVDDRPSQEEYAALQARLEAMEARTREPARLPRRVRGPQPQPTAHDGHSHEAELEALGRGGPARTWQPLRQILAAQLAQNNGTACSAAGHGRSGGSGSGDSTGIRLPCSGSLPGSRPDYEQSRPSGLCLRDLDFLETKLVPPLGARVGDPISPQQHVVLDRLEQFADRLLVTPSFQPESLDRCGPKFAAFAKVAKELPGTRILGVDQLLLQLVQSLKGGLDPYGPVSADGSGSYFCLAEISNVILAPLDVVRLVASGELNLEAGFVQSTIIHKMRKANEAWIRDELRVEPESVFADNRATELAVRGCGLHLFSSGLPRYLLIYSITAVQNEFPSFRNHLTGAWQIDKKWQLVEPGQCRSALPAAAVRACLTLAALWGWKLWLGLVIIGCTPLKCLACADETLSSPATASVTFAQRQHGRIDDEFAIRIIKSIFGSLARDSFLYPASAHTFRRQWDAIMSRLGIPHRAASQGATPGVLRGGGATHLYQRGPNFELSSTTFKKSGVVPYGAGLTFEQCPTQERLGTKTFDMQARRWGSGSIAGCYSPCLKLTDPKWNNTASRGRSRTDDVAAPYCCPTPPISPQACRAGPVEETEYVKAVHKYCPGVYAYCYDDAMGLLQCSADSNYELEFFCPWPMPSWNYVWVTSTRTSSSHTETSATSTRTSTSFTTMTASSTTLRSTLTSTRTSVTATTATVTKTTRTTTSHEQAGAMGAKRRHAKISGSNSATTSPSPSSSAVPGAVGLDVPSKHAKSHGSEAFYVIAGCSLGAVAVAALGLCVWHGACPVSHLLVDMACMTSIHSHCCQRSRWASLQLPEPDWMDP